MPPAPARAVVAPPPYRPPRYAGFAGRSTDTGRLAAAVQRPRNPAFAAAAATGEVHRTSGGGVLDAISSAPLGGISSADARAVEDAPPAGAAVAAVTMAATEAPRNAEESRVATSGGAQEGCDVGGGQAGYRLAGMYGKADDELLDLLWQVWLSECGERLEGQEAGRRDGGAVTAIPSA